MNLKVTTPSHATKSWALRHNRAVSLPLPSSAICGVIDALAGYGKAQEEPIGEDSYAGPNFAAMLRATRRLLSTELGDLDAGTLDVAILKVAKENGISEEEI